MKHLGDKLKASGVALGAIIATVGVFYGLVTAPVGEGVYLMEWLAHFLPWCLGSLLTAWLVGLILCGLGQLVENSDVTLHLLMDLAVAEDARREREKEERREN